MKTIALTILSIPFVLLALSCTKPAADPAKAAETAGGNGAVAVVDLDKVAKSMGWADDMTKNLQQTQSSCRDQLMGFLQPSQEALKEKRKEIIKAANLDEARVKKLDEAKTKTDLEQLGLSTKQIEELGQAAQLAYNESAGAAQKLNQIVENQRKLIVNKYRETVTPSVRRVAMANNKSIVLIPGGDLLYSDTASDLSDKVIDDLQHASIGTVVLPPIPVLKLEMPPASTSTSTTPPSTTRPK